MSWKPIKSTDPLKAKAVAALRATCGIPTVKVTNVQQSNGTYGGGIMVRGDLMTKPAGGRGGKFTRLGNFTARVEA